MSGQNDLNLDDILAEFHLEEERPAQRPAPRSARPKPAEPILSSGQKAAEGTLLYEGPAGRHAAPAAETEEAESAEPKPLPREEKPAPAPVKKPEPRPQAEKPAAKRRTGRETAAKKPSPGKGFALMILVLLLFGAALAGLLHWTAQAEKAAAPKEPEPLRLELGLSLERSLDESAATTR